MVCIIVLFTVMPDGTHMPVSSCRLFMNCSEVLHCCFVKKQAMLVSVPYAYLELSSCHLKCKNTSQGAFWHQTGKNLQDLSCGFT
jgi:hypothetical protein